MKNNKFLVIVFVIVIIGVFYYVKEKPKQEQFVDNQKISYQLQDGNNIDINDSTVNTIALNENNTGCCGYPYVLIGKTKQDYSNFVWFTLDRDNNKIVGGPSPKSDFVKKIRPLNNGYITGPASADIPVNVKIEDYIKMDEFPAPFSFEQLYRLIITKEPFTELYRCSEDEYKGFDTTAISAINDLINTDQLSNVCEKII